MEQQLKKRMTIMIICLAILFGSIAIYKIIMGFLLKQYLANQSKLVSVSTMKVTESPWIPLLTANGSLRAINGVYVTTELAGMVEEIYFKPGSNVQKNTILVQLNISTDVAQLNSLKANLELAKITYNRDKAQYAAKAVSKQTVDNDAANLESLKAQVIQQEATIAKKIIRAPFTGKLGISLVNPGQYVNPGDKVVTLQQLDPIYVDFTIPQQQLNDVRIGQNVEIEIDTFSPKKFFGKITTVDPLIDVTTRNVVIEATIGNPKLELYPGMFATVVVKTGSPKKFITVPQTAVTFNPYGDIVYIVKETGKDKDGKPVLAAYQNFVTTGETRGEQIAILKGLKKGDEIVTSGQLKLKNGSLIAINNTIVPSDNPTPSVGIEG